MVTNLVEIFYIVDEFCKEIEKTMQGHLLPDTQHTPVCNLLL